ncbi:rubrivinodin family lasso peptide [Piscinibacter sakaiensis]
MDQLEEDIIVDLGDAKEVTKGFLLGFNEELIDAMPRSYE